jgi:hypothetical protein
LGFASSSSAQSGNSWSLYSSLLGSALIDKHLQISKQECLEDASHDFSDGDGRLDEPAVR